MAATNLQFLRNLKRLREYSDSKRRVHSVRRRLRKSFGKSLDTWSSFIKYDLGEPICLSQCAVLRTNVKVDVDEILLLHKLYKYYQKSATKLLGLMSCSRVKSINSIDSIDSIDRFEEYVKGRIILRTVFEERLKSTGQLFGIVGCDPDITPGSLELYQQIFQAQGMINEGESHLLATIGGVGEEIAEDWFEATQNRCRVLIPHLVKQWRRNRALLRIKRRYQKPPILP